MVGYTYLGQIAHFLSLNYPQFDASSQLKLRAYCAFRLLGIDSQSRALDFADNTYLLEVLNCNIYDYLEFVNEGVEFSLRESSLTNKEFSSNQVIGLDFIDEVLRSYHRYVSLSREVPELIGREFKGKVNRTALEAAPYYGGEVLDRDSAARFNEEILALAASERANGTAHLYGNGSLQRIWKLPNKIRGIDKIIDSPEILNLLNIYFDRQTLHDKFYITSFQANILYPDAKASKWHKDNNLLDSSINLTLKYNIGIPLADLTDFNGATEFKESSEDASGPDKANISKLRVTAGHFAGWSGNIVHRSSSNTSKQPRVLILICFVNSVFRDQCIEENYAEYKLVEENYHNARLFGRLLGVSQGCRS